MSKRDVRIKCPCCGHDETIYVDLRDDERHGFADCAKCDAMFAYATKVTVAVDIFKMVKVGQ